MESYNHVDCVLGRGFEQDQADQGTEEAAITPGPRGAADAAGGPEAAAPGPRLQSSQGLGVQQVQLGGGPRQQRLGLRLQPFQGLGVGAQQVGWGARAPGPASAWATSHSLEGQEGPGGEPRPRPQPVSSSLLGLF